MANTVLASTFYEVLADLPPYQARRVKGVLESTGEWNSYKIIFPPLMLHCDTDDCGGERWYSAPDTTFQFKGDENAYVVYYCCDNCEKRMKFFAVYIARVEKIPNAVDPECMVVKFGELAQFGTPVPSSVLELIGPDRETFLAGRRCENQGLGIGAFAYYRRIVESQKNRILDSIINVVRKTNGDEGSVKTLEDAKREKQFSKAVEIVKDAIPDALRIDGHNPLTVMHDALSDGLHALSDGECLEFAEALRIVLTRFAERSKEILREENELKKAMTKLMSRKKAPSESQQGA